MADEFTDAPDLADDDDGGAFEPDDVDGVDEEDLADDEDGALESE
jgi:hypothetical protein